MRFRITLLALPLFLAACAGTPPTTNDVEGETASSAEAMMEDDTAMLGKLEVDYANSTITFEGNSTIIDHTGSFEKFTVTIDQDDIDPSDLTKAVFAVEIDLSSVKTDTDGLTAHLMREDFFNVAKFPKATFRSTNVTKIGTDRYSITGNMTIKGTTRPLLMNAAITRGGLESAFMLLRKEYGVGNDSYGNKLLDEEVPVKVNIRFVR